ncbi:MAG TPA: hypothetical protein VHB73_04090 [Alphaproteobacteria bacterium]|nr:hypothetical protein [Alphaproteobacteria bacterium]
MPATPKKPSLFKVSLPLLVACLAALVVMIGGLGYAAFRNAGQFNGATHTLQKSWDDRLAQMALPNQGEARSAVDADRQLVAKMDSEYRNLHRLLALAIGVLSVFIIVAYGIYRALLAEPLRKLEESCRDLTAHGMRGSVWGTDRSDIYGNLARAISELRSNLTQLADMSVEGPDGVHLVRFTGRGGAAFGTLISDLQAHVRNLQEKGELMQRRMDSDADHWQRKVNALGDVVTQTAASLQDAVGMARQDMQGLHNDNQSLRDEARALIDKLSNDIQSINQTATATSESMSLTLESLRDSDYDLRRATQQNLQASETFSKHAADLSEKLVAATTLMRASGKVMAETTDAARTRFLEAVQSVETHDQALRAFLADTSAKTGQIAALYEDIAGSAQRVNDTVERFDARIAEFGDKSDAVLAEISASGAAMDDTSGRLHATSETMAGAMDAMRGHTDMLAKILASMRDEHAGAMAAFRTTLGEAHPAITKLKEAGESIESQLKQEWAQYAMQSHQLLSALEQDARSMNLRTAQVSQDTDKLIAELARHGQHLSQTAGQFDLHVSNVSQRLEAAATNVMRSNQDVANITASQIGEIHGAVSEMVQRLGILTQLTGTLGSVAGQIGQLIPALSDLQHMPIQGVPMQAVAGAGPAVSARFEKLNSDFTGAIQNMRGEFDTVRGQISRWVETLSSGYQRMAQQIVGFESKLDAKLSGLRSGGEPAVNAAEIAGKLAPSLQLIHQSLADENGINQRMAQSIEVLKTDLAALRQQVDSSSTNLDNINDLLVQGFSHLTGSSAA